MKQLQHIPIVFTLLTLLALSGCGGGGGAGTSDSGGSTSQTDTTPDDFAFNAQTDVPVNQLVNSNNVVISGISNSAAIVVSGGEYAIDGGSFTSAAGTITVGSSVQVRLTSAAEFSTDASATLTVGTVSAAFVVTTVANTAPTAKILFPPRESLTDQNTITVRGTASDTEGDKITAVTVNGVTVDSDDNFATWQVTLPLSLGDNLLEVATRDEQDHANSSASTALIHARPFPFLKSPDENGLRIDSANNRALVLDGTLDALLSFDLSTGERRVISSNAGVDNFDHQEAVGSGPTFTLPEHMVLDTANNRVLALEQLQDKILAIDLNTGERSVFYDQYSTPGSGTALTLLRSVLLDEANNRFFVMDGFNGDLRLFSIALDTENRTLIAGSTRGSGPALDYAEPMALDLVNNRMLVAETVSGASGAVIAINLSNGNRTVLSGLNSDTSAVVGSGPTMRSPKSLSFDSTNHQVLIADGVTRSMFLVDLDTGDRTQLSGTGPEFIGPVAADHWGDNQIVVIDNEIETAFVVNRSTGDRQVLPNNGLGDGERFQTPRSIVSLGDQFLVADEDANKIFAVDAVGGHREVFLDGVDSLMNTPKAMVLDSASNRALIIDNLSDQPRLLALDLTSKALTVLSGQGVGSGQDLQEPEQMVFDAGHHRILLTDSTAAAVLAIDLITGNRTVVSDDSSDGPEFRHPSGITLTADGASALVVDPDDGVLYSVDLTTGARTVVSGENPDTGEITGTEFAMYDRYAIALDTIRNRALLSKLNSQEILAVDLATGIVTTVGDHDRGNGPDTREPTSLIYDADSQSLIFVDAGARAVYAMDAATGERAIISWSERIPRNNLY